MNLHSIFIEPSSKIESPSLRLKAEITTWIILIRTFLLIAVLGALVSLSYVNPKPMIAAILISCIASGLARTRYFQIATILVILESLIAIPGAVVTTSDTSVFAIGGPAFLAMGPLIASFALSIPMTVAVVVATCVSFFFTYLHSTPEFHAVVLAEFAIVMMISGLAVLGAVLRDRSDRIMQAQRAKVMQSSKLASLGEMASGVAHELNTPLAAILLNAEMAAEELREITPPSGDAIVYLAEIAEIAERMGRIISGLKNFARDSEHEHFEQLRLSDCVEDALRLCEQRIRASKIELSCDLSELAGVVLPARGIQLSQAVLNLLNNAFDAAQDQDKKWIRVETRFSGESIEILVTDSGSGISPSDQERLFEPFYTTKDYGKGTGLGLSISKGIAQAHNGDIFYDTTSVNTRFVLRLPLESKDHHLKFAA